jgi:hypothetical protein
MLLLPMLFLHRHKSPLVAECQADALVRCLVTRHLHGAAGVTVLIERKYAGVFVRSQAYEYLL